MSNYNPDTQLIKELPFVNCRDLGGMPLEGGKTFKEGLFLRSESPQWLTKEGIQKVKDYGVKTVLDLRGTEEIRQREVGIGVEVIHHVGHRVVDPVIHHSRYDAVSTVIQPP